MTLVIDCLRHDAIPGVLEDLARLRIAVFREWPYLYDGSIAYEKQYLAQFAASTGAVLVAAWDGDRLVGAATGAPMADHDDAFAQPLRQRGLSLDRIFYCAESVLFPDYRGQGAGHFFFDQREAHARAMGFQASAFCAVVRPETHPARPSEYRPLDVFWKARGYAPLDGAVAQFSWRDLGDDHESEKSMQIWMRDL